MKKPSPQKTKKKRKLRKTGTEYLAPKEWIETYREVTNTKARERLAAWILVFIAVQLCATVLIHLLVGFEFRGFSLPTSTLHWLGTATIGNSGALALIVYRFHFNQGGKK